MIVGNHEGRWPALPILSPTLPKGSPECWSVRGKINVNKGVKDVADLRKVTVLGTFREAYRRSAGIQEK